MKIDGLKTIDRSRSKDSIFMEFVPEGRRMPDRIRLRFSPEDEVAIVSFMDYGGLKPEPENAEIISILGYDPNLAKRIVSAMAVMHLRVDEAENNFTAADIMMIEKRFVVGRYKGSHPAWVRGDGKMNDVILNAEGTGLPAVPTASVQSKLIGPQDSSVTYLANSLADGIGVIDNGYLRFRYLPRQNIELNASPPHGALLN